MGGFWGYINHTGALVIPPIYNEAYAFSNGVAFVHKITDGDFAYGYSRIDTEGNYIIEEPIYTPARITPAISYVGDFEIGKYGYMHPDGSVALEFIYDESTVFAADRSFVFAKYEGLWGIIDIDGNWLIPVKFKGIQGTEYFIQGSP